MKRLKPFYLQQPSNHLPVFTCVSYAEAHNSYRLDVCPSVRPSFVSKMTYNVSMGTLNPTIPYHTVTRWYCIKTAEHIVMLSSPHDSPFILVLCVSKIFAKFRGRQTEVGYDKTGDISETRRVDQSIDTTCYQLSSTVDCDQHTRDRVPCIYREFSFPVK